MRLLVLVAVIACVVGVLGEETQLTDSERMAIRQSVKAEMKLLHPPRQSRRTETPLQSDLDQRAEVMFRALDADGNQVLDQQEVTDAPHVLHQYMPGVNSQGFAAFVEVADSNQDQRLDRAELKLALSKGLKQLEAQVAEDQTAPELLETDAHSRRRTGFLGGVGRFVKGVAGNALNGLKRFARGVTGKVDTRQDICVMCQYIVERCEVNVRASGIIPGLTVANAAAGSIFLQTEQQEAATQMPMGVEFGAASVVSAARATTRYQRQMERQKYNEIYRIMDVTLDDVCEQGMPPRFYKYCKMVYQTQSEIVDGLRYQYRAADICFRVGMCNSKSYITKGVHSRYNQK